MKMRKYVIWCILALFVIINIIVLVKGCKLHVDIEIAGIGKSFSMGDKGTVSNSEDEKADNVISASDVVEDEEVDLGTEDTIEDNTADGTNADFNDIYDITYRCLNKEEGGRRAVDFSDNDLELIDKAVYRIEIGLEDIGCPWSENDRELLLAKTSKENDLGYGYVKDDRIYLNESLFDYHDDAEDDEVQRIAEALANEICLLLMEEDEKVREDLYATINIVPSTNGDGSYMPTFEVDEQFDVNEYIEGTESIITMNFCSAILHSDEGEQGDSQSVDYILKLLESRGHLL